MVAAALVRPDGRVLMQRRRVGGSHGGLWEFPGGKIDRGETPEQALVREIEEELGVALDPGWLMPLAFAGESHQPRAVRARYFILLYMCRQWDGEPRCLDGEEIAWFAPDALTGLAMPPLDVPLAQALMRAI